MTFTSWEVVVQHSHRLGGKLIKLAWLQDGRVTTRVKCYSTSWSVKG